MVQTTPAVTHVTTQLRLVYVTYVIDESLVTKVAYIKPRVCSLGIITVMFKVKKKPSSGRGTNFMKAVNSFFEKVGGL